MTTIDETSTISAKGQTTVPKSVRQALRVAPGDKIAFRIEDGRVTVHNPSAEHDDPAVTAFLRLIEKDVACGGAVHDLPRDLAAVLRRIHQQVPVDLEEELAGEVAL